MERTWCRMTVFAVLVGTGPATAQTPNDTTAIRAAALDYIEGWYEGDPLRMERALHPRAVKRFQEHLPDGTIRLTETSGLQLVQQTRQGGGSRVPKAGRGIILRVLDVYQDVASVRVDAHQWVDYLHLARQGGRWRIVNVLWEVRRPAGRSLP